MRKTAIILALLCTASQQLSAQEVKAGDAKIESGKTRGLWERATLKGVVYSDFAHPEKGKTLDLSRSKTKELSAKVDALKANALCSMEKGKSKLGDDLVVLRNGLLKVVIVPKYGGRIIEISNLATGSNIFIDRYQDATKAPDWIVNARTKRKSAPMLGGWIENVDDGNQAYWNTPHTVETVKSTDDEVIVRTRGEVPNETWGVKGTVTVERTIGIRRGSARVKLHVKLTNHSGQTQREMRFKSQALHALGKDASGDEFWISAMRYVTRVPANHKSDCYISFDPEDGKDRWQGIIDRDEREGVVILPGGGINGRIDIFGSGDGADHWYTFENNSTLREHVIEGDTIEIDHDYAPVLNFDAITYADEQVAVEFVPEKLHFAPGEKVKAMIGAARLSVEGPQRVLIVPAFRPQTGAAVVGKLIQVDARLLVSDPKTVEFEVPVDLPAGPCELMVITSTKPDIQDVPNAPRYRAFIAEKSGPFLSVLKPGDDGFGKGFSTKGERLVGKVVDNKTGLGTASGVFEVAGVSLPWSTDISPVGDAFKVTQTVDLSKLPKELMLQELGVRFPFRLGTDQSEVEVGGADRLRYPYQKLLRVTVGGNSGRDEQWLVDQARGTTEQEYQKPMIPYWALSDSADRLPVWRFGGVLQMDATTAWVWKSSNYDSSPMRMIEEREAAGWVDAYSLLTKQGILVAFPRMKAHPPKEIIFDGEGGSFAVYASPPHVPAMSLTKAGKRGKSRAETWGLAPDGKVTFTFYVMLHDEDLTGHLPDTGNVAGKVRRIVDAWRP